MTKDEIHNHIKSVAEYYVSESWNTFLDLDEIDLIMAGIGVGKIIADEQEKRITELEKENAELREKYLQVTDEGTSFAHLKSLERENAELKTDYEVLSCSVGVFGELQDKLEEEQRKNNGLSDNLTEAKGLIRNLLRVTYGEGWNYSLDWKVKAEQFLSEVEK